MNFQTVIPDLNSRNRGRMRSCCTIQEEEKNNFRSLEGLYSPKF